MMEKLKTLNNSICADIVRNACYGNFRAVCFQLYNLHDVMTTELFLRVVNLVFELCPPDYEKYKSLPCEIQSFFNQLWLRYG